MDSEYIDLLKETVTQETLEHCRKVMQEMGKLSELYQLNYDEALVTGLLHDVAKDMEPEMMKRVARKASIKLHHGCERLPPYLHGPVGAYVAKSEFEISSKTVQEAIAKHTFCAGSSVNDSKLSWCLRFADVLAPTMEWKGMEKLRDMVYARQLEKAQLLHVRWLMEFLEESSIPLHPSLVQIYKELHGKVQIPRGFFSRHRGSG
jgi:predicted HD superfamily hydrolase involved in NAD metabolism